MKWIPKVIEDKFRELHRLGNGPFNSMTWEDLQAFPKWEDRQKRIKLLQQEIQEFQKEYDSLRSKKEN